MICNDDAERKCPAMETCNLAYKDPPRVERIEGKTYLMSPRPRLNHNRVAFRIARIFADYLEGKTCESFCDGTDVHLDNENTYIPDAMIVCDRSIIKDDGIYGAPDLVVEVLSPSTMQNDRGPKMRHYAAAGVKEYWIVSPIGQSVEVYYNYNGYFMLDAAYTVYSDQYLARMDDDERQAIRYEIPVSLYKDFRVNVKDVFKDIIGS